MSNLKRLVLAAAAASALQLAFAAVSHAIPAFTRQYKVECTTCHTIFPELNEYGEVFLKNSYVYPKAHGAQPAAKGGEEAKGKPAESLPEGLLLAGIPELVPVSFVASINAGFDPDARNEFDLSTRSLRLLAASHFREKAAFYVSYNAFSEGTFDPRASTVPANNNPDIEELFFVWRHALDTPVNVRLGRMQPKLGLFKKSNKISVASSFAPYSYKVGLSPFSIESTADAIEVNTLIGSRAFASVGLANRKEQNSKEGYGHISYKWGGADYKGGEPEISLDSESFLDFLSVTVSGYAYFGRNSVTSGAFQFFNDYYRVGGDLDAQYKALRLRVLGVVGEDDNPFFVSKGTEQKSRVFAGELQYQFGTSPLYGSNIVTAFRFEYQDDGSGAIVRRYIPTVAYTPIENVKLLAEYRYADSNQGTDKIGTIGAAFSF